MSEDRKRAQEMATQDLKNLVRRVVTGPGQIIASDNEADWPDDDGAGAFIPFTMGLRGELTKQAARKSADAWRKVTRRYPKAGFCIQLAGYDQDPAQFGNSRRRRVMSDGGRASPAWTTSKSQTTWLAMETPCCTQRVRPRTAG